MLGLKDSKLHESPPPVVLQPRVHIRSATITEKKDASAWLSMNGIDPFDLEVVEYLDGGTRHSPEVVGTVRGMLRDLTNGAVTLFYVHQGQQSQCLMPLLPSLLFQVGHEGPAYAIRCDGGTFSPTDAWRINRFALAQVADGSHALVIDDRQMRIGRIGSLAPAPVHISLLSRPETIARSCNQEIGTYEGA